LIETFSHGSEKLDSVSNLINRAIVGQFPDRLNHDVLFRHKSIIRDSFFPGKLVA
jgi:hypothetical protein